MGHAVHYHDAEGQPQLEDVASLEAAIERAEQLRNEAGVEQVRLFREVRTQVRTYYRVVVVDDDQSVETEVVADPQAPTAEMPPAPEAAPAPESDTPPAAEQAPAQPPAADAPPTEPPPGAMPLTPPPQVRMHPEASEGGSSGTPEAPESPPTESKRPSFLYRNS